MSYGINTDSRLHLKVPTNECHWLSLALITPSPKRRMRNTLKSKSFILKPSQGCWAKRPLTKLNIPWKVTPWMPQTTTRLEKKKRGETRTTWNNGFAKKSHSVSCVYILSVQAIPRMGTRQQSSDGKWTTPCEVSKEATRQILMAVSTPLWASRIWAH